MLGGVRAGIIGLNSIIFFPHKPLGLLLLGAFFVFPCVVLKMIYSTSIHKFRSRNEEFSKVFYKKI